MNLDDALLCLFLRLLRGDRLTAIADSAPQLASTLAGLADHLRVSRDKVEKVYQASIEGTSLQWTIPESDFIFYLRGDRKNAAEASVSAEDSSYDQNLSNAKKWLEVFRKAYAPGT
ncbi:MAG: hypothetical protein ABI615_01670 [Chthoniobacterales bacterium]